MILVSLRNINREQLIMNLKNIFRPIKYFIEMRLVENKMQLVVFNLNT